MRRLGRAWVVCVAVVLAATGGCGSSDGDEAENPAKAALTSAAASVKQAKTVRASFQTKRVGSILTGEADVVAGNGVSGSYLYKTNPNLPSPVEVKGKVVTLADAAYLRASDWKLPRGKKWYSVDPGATAKLDAPVSANWLAMVMSRLLDPLFLLDQGLADATGLTSTAETLDGKAVTKYTVSWNVELDAVGPELAAWAEQTGDGTVFDLNLWIGADKRPVKLDISSSTSIMQFWTEVTFEEYGADVSVTAPDAGEVSVVKAVR